jgi:hypothetical protein
MDKFTRNYAIGLTLIALLLFSYWLATFNYRIYELNKLIKNDHVLADYPYQFHVKTFSNGIAELTTPRSADIPATRFLSIIYPDLKGVSTEDLKFIMAEQKLAILQAHAKQLILSQPDVEKIRWVLDSDWYLQQGIFLN